ncbi:MAG: hyperosmotically inducible periplasmic protein [Gammaproteobacteria bacterium]|jgi:osmotically-inducible protein OsmY|nr:hyperosmotically inducible periplasmic protein [Gammaproteobacteria bacterium]
MHRLTTFSAAAIIMLSGALSGCAVFDKCTPEHCSTDKQITLDLNALLGDHRELGPPGTVHVQTINGVVYLNGTVNSEFEIRSAEAVARQVSNVKDVVNNLNPRSNAR